MWKLSIFEVFLVCIFQDLDWIRRYTAYLSIFSPNAWKYGPEKLQIRILAYFLVMVLVFKILAQTNQPKYPQARWWLTDVSFKTGYSCLFAIDITPWFALLYTIDFTFSETFLNFTFPKIFNNWLFSYSNDETRTCSFLGRNLFFFAIKVCMVKTIMHSCSISLCRA